LIFYIVVDFSNKLFFKSGICIFLMYIFEFCIHNKGSTETSSIMAAFDHEEYLFAWQIFLYSKKGEFMVVKG